MAQIGGLGRAIVLSRSEPAADSGVGTGADYTDGFVVDIPLGIEVAGGESELAVGVEVY